MAAPTAWKTAKLMAAPSLPLLRAAGSHHWCEARSMSSPHRARWWMHSALHRLTSLISQLALLVRTYLDRGDIRLFAFRNWLCHIDTRQVSDSSKRGPSWIWPVYDRRCESMHQNLFVWLRGQLFLFSVPRAATLKRRECQWPPKP